MESNAQHVNLGIPYHEGDACTSLVLNVNTNFVLVVTSHSKWVSSVEKEQAVPEWDFMHITQGIVCFI